MSGQIVLTEDQRRLLRQLIEWEDEQIKEIRKFNPDYNGIVIWRLGEVGVMWQDIQPLIIGGLVRQYGRGSYMVLRDRALQLLSS
ncbi:MAG: hypothetical protein QW429_05805, partial [Thermoprotei archaeon]